MRTSIIKRYWHDIQIAVEAIQANQVKSFLTALGIIFGVAAVISMLAIGNGAKEEILEQMKMIGVNNIVITPVTEDENQAATSEDTREESKEFSPGLTLADAEGIAHILPNINRISPHIFYDSYVIFGERRSPAKLEGVSVDFFELFDYQVAEGEFFNDYHLESGAPVCIIGSDIATQFFDKTKPIGSYLKCGREWLQVVGVLEKRNVTTSSIGKVIGGNSNAKIYIPIKTMLMRYTNRSLITNDLLSGNFDEEESGTKKRSNYHQLDKIILQVKETEGLNPSVEVLNRYFIRRHSGVEDVEITVPELLLKQQQKTKDIFNLVLGAIASISLIVGGIGIMNIMLASVMERIREIGTRQAIGAKRKDIVVQFLAESTLISIVGGIFGIFLGVVLSHLISHFAEIKTIISVWSVVIAFGVSASIGIIFGYVPAKRASERDPVESLRYE
ncbi:MAG: ABC transporter permease [Bacteroidales bacterium]|nr:ABC transporter permease [Bacteroidales bacterium]